MDKHLLHKRSATPNAKPLATDILHGEIAVNYADGSEALSIKNTKDEIITLPFNGGGGVSGDYVAKSGDTMTGDLTVEGKVNIGDGNTVTGENAFVQGRATRATNLAEHANGAYNISTFISATGIEQLKESTEATLFSVGNGVDDANRKNAFEVKWNGDVYFSGDTKFAKTITADTITANKFVGVVTGNADSADKLSTPRTITLDGDVTGSVAFDGSQDVTITTDIVGDFATQTSLTDGLALKSDLTYVDAELAKKANTATTYTKDEVNASMLLKANVSDVYSKTDADAALALKYDITAADAKFATQTSLTDGLATKEDKGVAYSKAESNTLLADKANVSDVYTISATDALLLDKADKATMTTELDKKFDTSAHTAYVTTVNTALDAKVDTSAYTEDKATFETKANASATYETIDNVTTKLATKQDTLTAGANVTITNNIISTKSAVESVNTKTGVVVLTAADVNAYTKTEVDTAITTAKGDIDTKLDTKVDKTTYATDKDTFETKTNASATYETKTNASATYETKTNVATIKSDLETAIGTKQATLTAGDNVTISDTNEISSTSNVELVQDATDSLHYTLNVDGAVKGEINIPKDQFLKSVTYNEATKTITFTFDTEGGEVVTPIDISHLVDVYEAGNGLTLTNNSFSINTEITATKASVDLKADSSTMTTELGKKVDVNTYNTDKATFALTSTVNAELAKKFDTSAHTAYVTTVNTALDAKVDKVTGKGLSTNDYTTEEKTKLAGLSNYDDTAVKGLINSETTRATDAESALGTRIDGTVAKSGDTMTGNLTVKGNVNIGDWTEANGMYSHAEGRDTIANGVASHAEGRDTIANGEESHAEGFNTEAKANASHAEGYQTIANGNSSHAEGSYTVANNYAEHANGSYNVSISGTNQDLTALTADTQATLFSIGNGVDENNRKNAFEVKYNGDVKILGTINQGSDRSLKHDITSLEDGILSKVSELNPTRFVMNTDNTNKVQIGFIAQEVEEIFPEFVSSIQMSNKEVKTVNYSMMVSVLCKSIQEMKSEMDEMRKELNELKKG